ncbi:stalk domain-containing protein [Cohnella faecalis]|uniref:Copper amine oxidase n=1 Tax=Cohnella faecalis TaxID=2315694 RepID=A0A398CYE1_9BACL|nr:stalk domain-containing protein [Cohnella faecalis]RIE04837.1 copper amine oxidase [Cohnella faecalis]
MGKWGKATLTALISLSIGASVPQGASEAAGSSAAASASVVNKVNVLLDDVALGFDSAPRIENSVTIVPFRTLAEALGINVQWEEKSQTVTATGTVNGKAVKVVLRVGSATASVNGQSMKLLTASVKREGRVLIPLNFFSTQFGAVVGWDSKTRTVSIVSPKREMHLRSFYALGSFKQRGLISSMNSVAFGWSRIDSNGEWVLDGADYNWPEAAGDITPESIVADASAAKAAPYLMVYSVDGNNELTRMLGDAKLRTRSIDSITKLVKEKGFGGVVLDFEGLGLKLDPLGQQKLLNDYVSLLADKLSTDGVKLSLAVPPPNGSYKGYDYKRLAELADDLVLMAYDYKAPGAPTAPEPNAKVDAAIALMLKAGVPKQKLLLGINLNSETPTTLDDKLGLAKRYDLKGAAFWALRYFGKEGMTEAMNASVTKKGN